MSSRNRKNKLNSKKLESVVQTRKIIKKARRRDRDNLKSEIQQAIAEDEEVKNLLDLAIPIDTNGSKEEPI